MLQGLLYPAKAPEVILLVVVDQTFGQVSKLEFQILGALRSAFLQAFFEQRISVGLNGRSRRFGHGLPADVIANTPRLRGFGDAILPVSGLEYES
jgi:hypothetical protein